MNYNQECYRENYLDVHVHKSHSFEIQQEK
jgi:hypothetical protein